MAALQKIRSHGVLLVGIIALALALFVIGDALRGGESLWNQSKQQVGEVDGEAMSIQEYQELTKATQNFYEIARQQSSFSEEEINQINDEAWNNHVQSMLIQKECDKLGLAVSDDEVAEVIKNGYSQFLQIPYFMNQQTQRYDYSIVNQILTEYKSQKEAGQQNETLDKLYNYYIYAQKQIRNQLLMQKYQVLLTSLFTSNPVEAKLSFDSRATQTDVLLASIPFTAVDDKDIKIEDSDLKNKYNEEKEKFVSENETRDLKVIDVIVKASDADKAETQKDMEEVAAQLANASNAKTIKQVVRDASSLMPYSNVLKAKDAFQSGTFTMIGDLVDSLAVGETSKVAYNQEYNAFYAVKLLDRVQKADSVCFRQIGVTGKDEKDIAAKADSIQKAIAAGADIKDIAKKYAQTADSAWVATQQFANASLDEDNTNLVNTIYSTAAGQTNQVKLANGNIIVIKVDQTKAVKTLYNAACVVKSLDFSNDTFNDTYNKLSSFVATNNTVEKLEAEAAKAGYVVTPLNNVQNSAHVISNIRGTHDALKWAFDEAKVGQVSELYESTDRTHIIVVALDGINKKGYLSQEKVNDYLTSQVRNEKKAEKIFTTVKDFASASTYKGVQIDTVKNISFAVPTFVTSTNVSEAILSAVAAKTEQGQSSKAVKGNFGVYALKVLAKKQSAEKFDAKSEESLLSQQNLRNATNGIMQVLYKNAKVVDNRYKFQ